MLKIIYSPQNCLVLIPCICFSDRPNKPRVAGSKDIWCLSVSTFYKTNGHFSFIKIGRQLSTWLVEGHSALISWIFLTHINFQKQKKSKMMLALRFHNSQFKSSPNLKTGFLKFKPDLTVSSFLKLLKYSHYACFRIETLEGQNAQSVLIVISIDIQSQFSPKPPAWFLPVRP